MVGQVSYPRFRGGEDEESSHEISGRVGSHCSASNPDGVGACRSVRRFLASREPSTVPPPNCGLRRTWPALAVGEPQSIGASYGVRILVGHSSFAISRGNVRSFNVMHSVTDVPKVRH